MKRDQHISVLCMLLLLHGIYIQPQVKFGLECISPAFVQKYKLAEKRVGLVTNQTGVDHAGNPSVIVLRNKGVHVTTIFAPEHGYTGTVPAGKTVPNSIEPITQLPIVSLYSHEKGLVGKTINKEKLTAINVLIFDMQEAGMRHYTYISTLMKCLEACAEYHKLCIVLDRPNLLGGHIEGPLVEPDLISFISIAPIPLRHGITIGELARFFNMHVLQKPAHLVVAPMVQYVRTAHNIASFKKALSPNLAHPQACLGYSFLGLLGEINPFNVGVGTKYAFRTIMLPVSIKHPASLWPRLQQLLTTYGIGSVRRTLIDERTKKKVTGLLLQFDTMQCVKTFDLFLDIISLFRASGVPLHCAPEFDKAVGMKAVRVAIENGVSLEPLKNNAQKMAQEFFKKIEPLLLYKPAPTS